MAMSMLTDTIEYDARRTGIRREGVYTAVYSFVEKFTFAMGPLIIGFAMQFAGFDPDLPVDIGHHAAGTQHKDNIPAVTLA